VGPATDRAGVPVLLVEDDASMARLVRHLLELDGYQTIRHVYTGEQAVTAAVDADIILLDHQLPDIRGIDLLPRLLGRADPPSVIMVTAHGSESLAAAALRLGAEDYLTKDHNLPELLPRILERVRRNRALRWALAEAEQELVRTERLAAIGEMNVTLHHELNNPLMVAMAEVELLLTDRSLPPVYREGLEITRTALGRMATTLRQSASLRQAEPMAYAQQLKMIDLSAAPEQPAQPFRGRALVCHPDQRVARVLTLLLRNAGFTVERPLSIAELQRAAEGIGVTLVAISNGGDADQVLGGFLPAPERGYTLLVLGAEHEVRARAAGADHVIGLPFDPATVITDILAALERQGKE